MKTNATHHPSVHPTTTTTKKTGLQLERVRDRLEASQGAAPTYEEWAATLNLSKDEMLRELAVADKAKKHMISANLRLVVSMARNYQHRGLAFPDLIQEGTMGLVKATEKFNPEMGFKFYTYATWWIKQSLLTGIANQVLVRMCCHFRFSCFFFPAWLSECCRQLVCTSI